MVGISHTFIKVKLINKSCVITDLYPWINQITNDFSSFTWQKSFPLLRLCQDRALYYFHNLNKVMEGSVTIEIKVDIGLPRLKRSWFTSSKVK